MSALQQLRLAIIAKRDITHDDTAVILDSGVRLPRTSNTNFRSLHGRGAAYTLETIYFQHKFQEHPYNEYVQSCKEKGVPHAFLIDKKDLLAYLSGEIDTCVNISEDAPPEEVPDQSAPSSEPVQSSDPAPTSSNKSDDPTATRERPAPRTAPRDSDSERSRKREREQCVLDASCTVIGWDYSQLRDKLVSSLAASRRAPPPGDKSKGPGSNRAPNKFDPRGDRYTSNEGRFWRENLGSDFNDMDIDMGGSFKAKSTKSSQSASRDRPGPPQPAQQPPRGSSREQERKKAKIDPQQRVPIVIVPSGDALITSMNAIEFMRDGHFMTREEMQKGGVSLAPSARKVLRRKPGGNCSQADYHIVSNPNRISDREWDQVVAVICSGQSWQFKKWPLFKGSAQQLFNTVQGFYFHFDDSPPKGEVREWPVRMMAVSRDRRHTDGGLTVQFWNCLDSFIARRKSHLRY